MIKFSKKTNLLSLHTKNTSYIMQVFKNQHLLHIYWGKSMVLTERNNYLPLDERVNMVNSDPADKSYYLEDLPFEYSFWGKGDFRNPSLTAVDGNGAVISNFIYESHTISNGKPEIPGLPSTFAEEADDAETLEIKLIHKKSGVSIYLLYTVFPSFDVITRNVKIENRGSSPVMINKIMAVTVDFAPGEYELLTLPGAWGRERWIERQSVHHGVVSIGSSRGISSHQFNPFLALLSSGTGENSGEVYGFNLVYSGNFLAETEKNQDDRVRINIGINPSTFSWVLAPGEVFNAPEAVLVYSDKGLNGMSGIYHKFYVKRLSRSVYASKERPVLVNNWEATYFSFNEKSLLDIAHKSKDFGIELFVLDDGWFGQRNSDYTSLGDWVVNKDKLPDGIEGLSGKIRSMGMKFGLWFEPEMISPDSSLFRSHPDWALQLLDSPPAEGRNQLVLDLSRGEVVDEIIRMLKQILGTNAVDYVKWDMNRSLTDIYSSTLPPGRQGELSHRYVLGLYRIMDEITSAFPDILFEGCAAGGGRFDPGILYYMPQYWTSDNTDAVSRLKIQYGTSLVYPQIFIGSHVSAVPNHQLGRSTGIEMRSHTAMMGNFGYELDFAKLDDKEVDIVRNQVSFYKTHRKLIQFGRFYRLLSPFEGEKASWMIVSEDKSEFVLFYYQILSEANMSRSSVKLIGLDEKFFYEETGSEHVYSGSELMYRGYFLSGFNADFQSFVIHFSKTKNS
ncbi:MAG: alpha-galactosidase [Spirochaetaceae bacterium]|nr:alpha-galactosidase [Spirochaetaceae bacterium]